MGETKQPYPDQDQTIAAFAEHVNRGKVSFYRDVGFDFVLGDRQGAVFGEAFGDRTWFNCHCNGGVFNLGHHHPQVVAAVRQGLSHLDIGNHHLISGFRAQLAERLVATTGGTLPGVVFGVGGGEAIDLAIKVVRGVTGRQKIISATGGYHGHTGLALAAGDAEYRKPFGPNAPGFVQVPFNDLDALVRAVTNDTAGVLLETVPATLGMPIPEPGYLVGIKRACEEHGAKLILDEVQTGLGRTGRLWGYEHDGIVPDVVVTGKGLSGGIYPIAATLMTAELHAFFDEHPFIHISTFGGADLGCLAALAVLDLIEAPGFLERVNGLAERFARGFEGATFTLRQRGLMMGLHFPFPYGGMLASKGCFEAGVFCVYANNDKQVLQFLPPLILTDEEADEIIARVRKALP